MEWSRQFTWRGETGTVRVECVPNDDPAGYGCIGEASYGFPICSAWVTYPRRDYWSMFGWVQLVRSSDFHARGTAFEVDPFALFGDSGSPYCWYGIEPTLFDAPSRSIREPLRWTAFSFLATTPIHEVLAGNPRVVLPLLGFSWGFELREDDVTLHDVAALTADEWNAMLPVLRAEYPSPRWEFAHASQLA